MSYLDKYPLVTNLNLKLGRTPHNCSLAEVQMPENIDQLKALLEVLYPAGSIEVYGDEISIQFGEAIFYFSDHYAAQDQIYNYFNFSDYQKFDDIIQIIESQVFWAEDEPLEISQEVKIQRTLVMGKIGQGLDRKKGQSEAFAVFRTALMTALDRYFWNQKPMIHCQDKQQFVRVSWDGHEIIFGNDKDNIGVSWRHFLEKDGRINLIKLHDFLDATIVNLEEGYGMNFYQFIGDITTGESRDLLRQSGFEISTGGHYLRLSHPSGKIFYIFDGQNSNYMTAENVGWLLEDDITRGNIIIFLSWEKIEELGLNRFLNQSFLSSGHVPEEIRIKHLPPPKS